MNATRYIITRPCLAEGSLSILKYLEPLLLPGDAHLAASQLTPPQVTFTDDKGERYSLTLDLPGRRLTGLGELYRDHNLGVNDVLLIRPEGPGRFSFEAVVKPLARPLTPAVAAAQAAARPPEPPRQRVVIHATPHVREVRLERGRPEQGCLERGPQDELSALGLNLGGRGQPTPAPEPAQPASPAQQPPAAQPSATPPPETRSPETGLSETKLLETRHSRTQPGEVRAKPPTQAAPTPQGGTPQGGAAQDQQARSQTQAQTPATPRPPEGRVRPAAELTGRAAPRDLSAGPTSARAASAQTPVPAVRVRGAAQASSAQPAPASPPPTSVPSAAPAPLQEYSAAEEQLAELARLTGYRCEFLGGGVVRLRAELGQHGYSVLLATGEEALRSSAWGESCDYMALLTPERVRPQGVPRFTHEALEALLDHARLAPLSPVDLRGYWNTGSFDSQSAASVAELVAAHLAQRGSFSYVLLTLAQQPAHSIVTLPRLAERLGSGVNTSELSSILDTLTRPPFLALSPLPGDQYYLRLGVEALLADLGEYAQGMGRRLSSSQLTN